MRTEDQVDTRAGPLEFVRLPVAPLVHAFRAGGRLPLRAHVEQVDEEVVGQRLRPLGEDAVLGLPGICAQDAQAADENRHLRRRQRQQLRPIHQQLLGGQALLAAEIVAEAVSGRFERRKGVHVGLLLRRVHAPRRERNLDVVSGGLRRFLDRRAAAENDQVSKRDLLPAGL